MVRAGGSRTDRRSCVYKSQTNPKTKMKIIHVIYLALVPLSIELGIEIFRARVLNRNDKHALSFILRAVVMAIGAFTYNEVPWWITLSVMITLHYAVFNYVFNRYGFEIPVYWGFLGNSTMDNLQKRLDPHVLLAVKIILLALSVIVLSFY